MKSLVKPVTCLAAVALFSLGCQSETAPVTSDVATPPSANESHDSHGEDAHDNHGASEVAAEMAKLSPEDRKEAEAQKFCVVSSNSLLGSMGAPIKLDIDGQAVFICCSGCKSAAMKAPEKTLATVAKLKAENSEAVK
jgi:hypothetical protein